MKNNYWLFRSINWLRKSLSSGMAIVVMMGFHACEASYEPPESAFDCGRQFINATYKGNFKRAGQLVLPNEANKQILLTRFEQAFRSRTSLDKETLSNASIVINKITRNGDSTTAIMYDNAYTNQPAIITVVKYEGSWKVDLSLLQ